MEQKAKYYRNKTEIKGCEPESLWELHVLILVLVDDDRYVWARMEDHSDVFYEVPDPFPKS